MNSSVNAPATQPYLGGSVVVSGSNVVGGSNGSNGASGIDSNLGTRMKVAWSIGSMLVMVLTVGLVVG